MRYLLLIAGDENARGEVSADDDAATLNEYGEWVKTVADRGILQGGERLRPTSDATTVRVRNGETLSTDGPFMETKEALGGYSVLETDTIEEAVEIARTWPGVDRGWITIEVRPVFAR